MSHMPLSCCAPLGLCRWPLKGWRVFLVGPAVATDGVALPAWFLCASVVSTGELSPSSTIMACYQHNRIVLRSAGRGEGRVWEVKNDSWCCLSNRNEGRAGISRNMG